jgi:hypothetical protein
VREIEHKEIAEMRKYIMGAAIAALSLGFAAPAFAVGEVIQPQVECVTPTPNGYWATFTYTAGGLAANGVTIQSGDDNGNEQNRLLVGGQSLVIGQSQQTHWIETFFNGSRQYGFSVWAPSEESAKWIVRIDGVDRSAEATKTGSQQCSIGEQGLQGEQGIQGPPGPEGPIGLPGVDGVDGEDGEPGAPGAMGPTGPQGPMGPEGPIGPTGPMGPQGPQGETGAPGKDGAAGANGENGTNGVNGTDGVNGRDGSAGAAGAAGTTTVVYVQAAASKPHKIGDTVRKLNVQKINGWKLVSIRALLRDKAMPVSGRTITVDLRNKIVGAYNVNVTVKYRKHGKTRTVRFMRALSVTRAMNDAK